MHDTTKAADWPAVEAPPGGQWSKLECILRDSGAVFWEVDANGIFTYASSSFAELLGYGPNELVGLRHVDSFYPVEMAPELEAELRNDWLSQHRPFHHAEVPLVAKDGRVCWVTSRGVPFFDAAGKLQGFRGTDIDITQRKEVEAKAREADRSVLLQISAAPVAIAYTTIGSDEFRMNRAFVDLFGYAPGEIPTIEDWFRVAYPDPAYRAEVARVSSEMMERAKSGDLPAAPREFKIRCKDGTVRDIEIASAVVGDCFFGTFTDRTARNRAQLMFAEKQKQLAHAGRVAAVGQMAASLAHELNQPLGAIQRNAEAAQEILRGEDPDLAELRSIIEDILADDLRAGNVLDRVRNFLRKDHELSMEAVEIPPFLQETASLVRREAAARGATLEVSTDPALPAACADRVLLQQALLNLLLNAIAVVPEGRGRITVHAGEDNDGMLVISVADNGGGLTDEAAERFFEPFYTTKSDGMGLGLPIARTIAEQHGGQLTVVNTPGRGLRVSLCLPFARVGDALT